MLDKDSKMIPGIQNLVIDTKIPYESGKFSVRDVTLVRNALILRVRKEISNYDSFSTFSLYFYDLKSKKCQLSFLNMMETSSSLPDLGVVSIPSLDLIFWTETTMENGYSQSYMSFFNMKTRLRSFLYVTWPLGIVILHDLRSLRNYGGVNIRIMACHQDLIFAQINGETIVRIDFSDFSIKEIISVESIADEVQDYVIFGDFFCITAYGYDDWEVYYYNMKTDQGFKKLFGLSSAWQRDGFRHWIAADRETGKVCYFVNYSSTMQGDCKYDPETDTQTLCQKGELDKYYEISKSPKEMIIGSYIVCKDPFKSTRSQFKTIKGNEHVYNLDLNKDPLYWAYFPKRKVVVWVDETHPGTNFNHLQISVIHSALILVVHRNIFPNVFFSFVNA